MNINTDPSVEFLNFFSTTAIRDLEIDREIDLDVPKPLSISTFRMKLQTHASKTKYTAMSTTTATPATDAAPVAQAPLGMRKSGMHFSSPSSKNCFGGEMRTSY